MFLKTFENDLFSGKLGSWKGEPYDIPTKTPLQPYHAKPYPIPYSMLDATKKEIKRLEELGVICRDTSSPWASPAFIIPKSSCDGSHTARCTEVRGSFASWSR